jgi:hypothetical protein
MQNRQIDKEKNAAGYVLPALKGSFSNRVSNRKRKKKANISKVHAYVWKLKSIELLF